MPPGVGYGKKKPLLEKEVLDRLMNSPIGQALMNPLLDPKLSGDFVQDRAEPLAGKLGLPGMGGVAGGFAEGLSESFSSPLALISMLTGGGGLLAKNVAKTKKADEAFRAALKASDARHAKKLAAESKRVRNHEEFERIRNLPPEPNPANLPFKNLFDQFRKLEAAGAYDDLYAAAAKKPWQTLVGTTQKTSRGSKTSARGVKDFEEALERNRGAHRALNRSIQDMHDGPLKASFRRAGGIEGKARPLERSLEIDPLAPRKWYHRKDSAQRSRSIEPPSQAPQAPPQQSGLVPPNALAKKTRQGFELWLDGLSDRLKGLPYETLEDMYFGGGGY